MIVSNLDFAIEQVKTEFFSFKALVNDKAIHFFPGNLQHLEQKTPDLSYEGEDKGNALAVVVNERRVEIRADRRFDQERVAKILWQLAEIPHLRFLTAKPFFYGGKEIQAWSHGSRRHFRKE